MRLVFRWIIVCLLLIVNVKSFAMTFTLSSPEFEPNQSIPTKFTCEGANLAPTLIWQGFPEETKSFALIMDDPDAPMGTWVHWVLFNIPATTKHLNSQNSTPNGAVNGTNSWGKTGYGGPCPPSGQHRYFFKLYALDANLQLKYKATKEDLEEAMKDHILAKTELIGLYQKQ